MSGHGGMTRLLKLGIVGALAAVVGVWFRRRSDTPEFVGTGTAQWPPLVVDAPRVVVKEPTDGTAAEPAGRGDQTWIAPESDGSCPLSHPIKAKASSGIYHQPDGLAYERTNADRCYPTPAAAEADGFRAAKR